ncbi:DegV family protein [Tissierella creatinini]|nr:DegV family protein [Tissierella creatinini]TJX65305.1 DegV family protein [Soehngenia saccharolytica]
MIHLVTDSTSDLPKEIIEKYHIIVVPLTISIDKKDYLEGIDISPEEFYIKMRTAKELPKTSMPSPGVFGETFKKLAIDGSVLCLTISSGLSGTYQSASLAVKDLEGDIRVIDTLAGSLGHGLQLIEAGELIEEGKTIDEIVDHLEEMKKNSRIFILLDTLENIVKGGRLSKFKGSLAKVLDIKVILHAVEGKVEILEKVHGRKKFLNRTLEIIGDEKKDFSNTAFGITHVNNIEDAEYLKNMIIDKYKPRDVIINAMGATMATYAGDKGIIISF